MELSIVFLALSTLICYVHCTKFDGPISKRRFRDMAQALNYMYENLDVNETMEVKCKRYAVLSSRALNERSPYIKTVNNVMSMDCDELNQKYMDMDTDRVIYSYVSGIDRYRITKLAPAFIDLIECLRRFDSPVVDAYLSSRELVIIQDLYKQVLGLPGTKINVETLNLDNFSKPFRASLKNLFQDHFGKFRQSPTNTASHFANPESLKDEVQSRRQQYADQRRERSRLIGQRLRIMNLEGVRKYSEERRKKLKELNKYVENLDSDTPEAVEFKQRERERRDKTNARRRKRRRQLRDQKEELMLADDEPSMTRTGRFKDIAIAANSLKVNLPADISIEEKCRRFAVFLDLALSTVFPHEQTVMDVVDMDKDDIDRAYEDLNLERISYVYMRAIDRYRVTQLAPPIIDIIECLKHVDTPAARTYLGSEEMETISYLYRQVLEHPENIDVSVLDLRKLKPASCEKLAWLFAGLVDTNKLFNTRSEFFILDTSGAAADTSNPNVTRLGEPQKFSRKRQRWTRRREMSRLKHQRKKLLNLDIDQESIPQVRQAQQERETFQKRKLSTCPEQCGDQSEEFAMDLKLKQNQLRRLRYKQMLEQPYEKRMIYRMEHGHERDQRRTRDSTQCQQTGAQLRTKCLLSLFPMTPGDLVGSREATEVYHTGLAMDSHNLLPEHLRIQSSLDPRSESDSNIDRIFRATNEGDTAIGTQIGGDQSSSRIQRSQTQGEELVLCAPGGRVSPNVSTDDIIDEQHAGEAVTRPGS